MSEIYFPEDNGEPTIYRSLIDSPEMRKFIADIDMINNMNREIEEMRPVRKAE